MTARTSIGLAVAALAAWTAAPAAQHARPRLVDGRPQAIVDLRTREGVALIGGQWRYSDARLVEVDSKGVGPDLRASGTPIRTLDIEPKAGAREFDDSRWAVIPAPGLDGLEARRGNGKLAFNWYRLNVTIPERVGTLETRGTTVVFEIVLDDYAEVWVDGRLPRVLGQTGGQLVKGFNAPNRVVLAHDVQPGQTFQLAVFGANGPLSDPPSNFIWVRSATLEFFAPPRTNQNLVATTITRVDPGLDAVVSPDAKIEKIAEGFDFIEGPVWVPDGYLLFSDPNHNVIYRWSDDDGLSIYRTKSGYTGADIGEYGQPGSNGLTLDAEGRLIINEHGNRRVTRLEKTGVITVLADRYQGKRLNSPNDLVYRSDGVLYFTDPPFGLPRFHDDPRRELPFSGVFALVNGTLKLASRDLSGPNGLAFSPDERYLYVDNWDPKRKVVMRYEARPDGSLANGVAFFDVTGAPGEEAFDGLKVDERGNVYVSGPGGLWIVSPEGKHLGTIAGPELAANFAWGDADSRTLYMAARTGLYRIRLNVAGLRPPFVKKVTSRD